MLARLDLRKTAPGAFHAVPGHYQPAPRTNRTVAPD